MTKLILELSAPRTGSSALGGMLQQSGTIAALGEVFHLTPNFYANLGRLARFYPEATDSDGSLQPDLLKRLQHLRWNDPVGLVLEFLDTAEARGFEAIQMKVFAGHLTSPQVGQIMQRIQPVCYILHRQPVDMYISVKKAVTTGIWGKADTSSLKPMLNAREFLRWRWRQQNHWQMAKLLARRAGLPLAEISYEEIYGSGTSPAERLAQFYRDMGINIGGQEFPASPRSTKQDKTAARADRVGNWDQFLAEIEQADARPKLDQYDLHGRPSLLAAQYIAEAALGRRLMNRTLFRDTHVAPDRDTSALVT